MNKLTKTIGLAALCLGVTAAFSACAVSRRTNEESGSTLVGRATGTFDDSVAPVAVGGTETVASGRLAIDKTYRGDLVGASRGEMWTVDTSVKGSRGYVAIERVSGTLEGRAGTFVLLHQGVMSPGGNYRPRLIVVPNSGTDQLKDLSGIMTISTDHGKHSYVVQYKLPGPAAAPPRGTERIAERPWPEPRP